MEDIIKEGLKASVLRALGKVEDPDLKRDLVSLGMIDQLFIEDRTISFTLVLTTPACPLQAFIKQSCIKSIQDQIGYDFQIIINTTAKVTSSRSKATTLPGVKNIIAVASGKGGVGKSTVASHLALALSKHGANVGLLDADIFGPSIPTMWGCSNQKPAVKASNGKKYMVPIEIAGVKLLSIGFLASGTDAIVWRGPMASAALKQLIQDTAWDQLDYLIVDLPPGTSDIHLTLVQTVALTGAVVVTTPQNIALIDAIKAIALFKKEAINVPLLGLIENMAYFTPEAATGLPHYIFGKDGGKRLAIEQGISFLGEVPLVPLICKTGDSGITSDETLSYFSQIAQQLAQQIAIRNAIYPPTVVVKR